MRRVLGIVALAVVLAACGSSGGGAGDAERPTTTTAPLSREDFVRASVNAGFTPDEAVCITDAVFDELDQDEIRAVYSATMPDDLPAPLATRFQQIVRECTT